MTCPKCGAVNSLTYISKEWVSYPLLGVSVDSNGARIPELGNPGSSDPDTDFYVSCIECFEDFEDLRELVP